MQTLQPALKIFWKQMQSKYHELLKILTTEMQKHQHVKNTEMCYVRFMSEVGVTVHVHHSWRQSQRFQ